MSSITETWFAAAFSANMLNSREIPPCLLSAVITNIKFCIWKAGQLGIFNAEGQCIIY